MSAYSQPRTGNTLNSIFNSYDFASSGYLANSGSTAIESALLTQFTGDADFGNNIEFDNVVPASRYITGLNKIIFADTAGLTNSLIIKALVGIACYDQAGTVSGSHRFTALDSGGTPITLLTISNALTTLGVASQIVTTPAIFKFTGTINTLLADCSAGSPSNSNTIYGQNSIVPANLTGLYNTFCGKESGRYILSANGNCALGCQSLIGTGGANVAIGVNTCGGTGGENVCISNDVGVNFTTAYRNIMIGIGCGQTASFSGGNNINIGYYSGTSSSQFTNVAGTSNTTIIGNNSTTACYLAGTTSVILNTALLDSTGGSGTVSIMTTPTTLTVGGANTVKLAGGTFTAGKVIVPRLCAHTGGIPASTILDSGSIQAGQVANRYSILGGANAGTGVEEFAMFTNYHASNTVDIYHVGNSAWGTVRIQGNNVAGAGAIQLGGTTGNGSTAVYGTLTVTGPSTTVTCAKVNVLGGSNTSNDKVTLTAGTVTVNNNSVTANSRIFLSRGSYNTSTVLGLLMVSTITPTTSFVIQSRQPTVASGLETNDVSDVYYFIIN